MSYNYDDYVSKSFFTDKNFSGRFAPSTLNLNMIPCNNIKQFHYETYFFLCLFTSLYIEIKKKELDFDYNINNFTEFIKNLNIIFDNVTNYNADTSVSNSTNKLSVLNLDNNIYNFTFYIKTLNSFTDNPNDLFNIIYPRYYINVDNDKPIFGDYPNILTLNNLINKSPSGNIHNEIINKNNIDNLNLINLKFKEILKKILNQTPENIIGYLLYQKINYNIILFNINIQNSIRRNYINNSIDLTIADLFPNRQPSDSSIIQIKNSYNNFINIKQQIEYNTNLLTQITDKSFPSNDFLLEKNQYRNKINSFNKLRKEFAQTQDKLNISVKLYNYQLNNYKKIKNYANYIIIILILIMVFTIFLTIFPIFKPDTKNAIYIITLIILSIITYIYYNNFKYVALYENFTADSDYSINKNLINCTSLITFNSTNNNTIQNHARLFRNLLPTMNNYSNAIDNLLNDLRMNIYTIGSKSFSRDSNIIIYNVYLEKKRQLEINNVKLTNLFNTIEIIKKQILYLFNFIFVIACLCIILLLGLVLYSSIPQLFIFIIILCIILIAILMIYFAFAIIQPTKMIANKNYWAIVNPTSKTMGKL